MAIKTQNDQCLYKHELIRFAKNRTEKQYFPNLDLMLVHCQISVDPLGLRNICG